MAGGQELAQGYHIGVNAFGNAGMSLHYYLYGPQGVASPSVEGISWNDEGGSPISLERFQTLGLV